MADEGADPSPAMRSLARVICKGWGGRGKVRVQGDVQDDVQGDVQDRCGMRNSAMGSWGPRALASDAQLSQGHLREVGQ